MRLHIGGVEWVKVVGLYAPRCPWRGPNGTYCMSYEGHEPWKSPSGPHCPSVVLGNTRPDAVPDPAGLI